MTLMQPYLLRALFDWIIDNDLTPYLLVNADYNEDMEIPRQYVEDGKIILNISPTALEDLILDNDWVSFQARFSGQKFSVYFPTAAVLAIYAKENGKGMFFRAEDSEKSEDSEKIPPPPKSHSGKPVLRQVKSPENGSGRFFRAEDSEKSEETPPPPKPPRGKPVLRRVK